MIAPVIPVLTDHELEEVLAAASAAGATFANYVVLRLPYEVKDLFREWLAVHEPLKADHVMSRLAELRGGRENDPRFGKRMAGTGIYADLLRQRFAAASRRLGLSRREEQPMPTHLFRPPVLNEEEGGVRQLRLDW
jgi:DNA repair photolyase